MSRVKLSMPSPALIVACLALIVAMGGTAYAALLPKNSVKSKSIAPGAVKTPDIANGAVTGEKLKAGAVTEAGLADGAVTSGKIADGTVGSGDLGPFSVKLANLGVVVNSRFADVALPDDGTRASVTAECPAGQVAASGGYSYAVPGTIDANDLVGDFHVLQSRPNITPEAPSGFPDQGSGFNSWRVTATNEAGGNTGPITLTAMVVCLRDR